jgi:hypothetical protein
MNKYRGNFKNPGEHGVEISKIWENSIFLDVFVATDSPEKTTVPATGVFRCCWFLHYERTDITVSFSLAKTRVVPVSRKPYLSWNYDTWLTLKLARVIRKDLESKVHKVTYWTDSTTMLQYIDASDNWGLWQIAKAHQNKRILLKTYYVIQWNHEAC